MFKQYMFWRKKRKYTRRKNPDISDAIKMGLIDNVKANVVLSPLYFILMMAIFMLSWDLSLTIALKYSFISTFIYVYASHYYQPDLDVHHNRPGMGHFPTGKWVRTFRIGRFIKWCLYPINRIWYWLWHPYGNLMTHRGIGHYPIIGVWIRTYYLWAFYLVFQWMLQKTGLWHQNMYFFEIWLRSFFPWDKNFATIFFLLFNFPIYLSDSVHWMVDYYDSLRKGISFCPPKIPRGLIVQTINFLKGGKNNEKSN